MKFAMQRVGASNSIQYTPWDVAVVGVPLDDRGAAAVDFVTKNSRLVIECEYRPQSSELRLDTQTAFADDAQKLFETISKGRAVLETTTLGFAEVYLATRSLKALGAPGVSFLYVEPMAYAGSKDKSLLNRRDFELSDAVPDYIPIPGATVLLQDQKKQRGVFFLGYEERRLDRALEDYPIVGARTCVVFGVPAFKPGWEMDAFANNIRVLRERRVRGGVHFCGAQNPEGAFQVLEEVLAGCDHDEQMFVAPIGTKPHGIGAALFAVAHPNVGILYDHPKRKKERAKAVSSWHLFEVLFQ